MANPMVIAALGKVVEDKRLRTVVTSLVAGVAVFLLVPLLAMAAIWNTEAGYSREIAKIVFDGGPIPMEADEELTRYMEEMIEHFEIIDETIETVEEEGLDDVKIKSFFYCLYFGEELEDMDEEFYEDFVECFIAAEDDGEIYEALEMLLEREFSEQEKESIQSLYLFIKYGYAVTDQVAGIPGEAFNDATFAKLMGEATKYIGFPYVWGGSSPSTSFDCSGFVCWVYTHSGVHYLPRTTAQSLYNQCTPVSRSEVKPGDLVFFTKTYQTNNPVTHVGIYVGENQMLHCGDPIGYAKLSSSYWTKHFYGFGRLS